MAEYGSSSGGIRPLYGVIIKDKCKHAPPATLNAYLLVAQDLLTDSDGDEKKELEAAIADLKTALAK
jgi:hypothetical protein